jgi:hypothetical protein
MTRPRQPSGFRSDVTGAGAFRGRFLVEVDALAFVQLIERALYRASVKEPLLSTVVADESKTSVTDESLDGTARHPISLGPRALDREYH